MAKKKRRLELPSGFREDNAEHLRRLRERIDYHTRKLAEEQQQGKKP